MYTLAVVSGGVCFARHNVIYTTRSKAESALNTMRKNGKLNDRYGVYEVRLFPAKE